jgi:hypothetical protein
MGVREIGAWAAAASRRFFGMLALAAVVTVAVSLLFGLLVGAPPSRAISLGFYLVGCFLLVGGFFVGNRGPARLRSDEDAGPFGFGSRRRIGWATADEREDALRTSALFVVLGLVLILLGVVADTRHGLL